MVNKKNGKVKRFVKGTKFVFREFKPGFRAIGDFGERIARSNVRDAEMIMGTIGRGSERRSSNVTTQVVGKKKAKRISKRVKRKLANVPKGFKLIRIKKRRR